MIFKHLCKPFDEKQLKTFLLQINSIIYKLQMNLNIFFYILRFRYKNNYSKKEVLHINLKISV